jgi:hypothetical protein
MITDKINKVTNFGGVIFFAKKTSKRNHKKALNEG